MRPATTFWLFNKIAVGVDNSSEEYLSVPADRLMLALLAPRDYWERGSVKNYTLKILTGRRICASYHSARPDRTSCFLCMWRSWVCSILRRSQYRRLRQPADERPLRLTTVLFH